MPIAVPSQQQPTPDQPPQFYLPDAQDWAFEQEKARHQGAMDLWGEYSMFVLLWNLVDFEAGLVGRCQTCYVPNGGVTDVYGQSNNSKCPDCYGTTFEGGFKAKIVRRSLWASNENAFKPQARGDIIIGTATVQAESTFRMRTGDYIFRGDGSRWQMRTMSSNELRTGFQMPSPATAVVGYNYGTVSREDESSVAYLIPPTASVLINRLNVTHAHWPVSFADLEVVRGSLFS